MSELKPENASSPEIPSGIKQEIVDHFGITPELDRLDTGEYSLDAYNPKDGYLSLTDRRYDPPNRFIDYALPNAERHFWARREVEHSGRGGRIREDESYTEIVYRKDQEERSYSYEVEEGKVEPQRKFVISNAVQFPPTDDFEVISPTRRRVAVVEYDEGKNTIEMNPIVTLQLFLHEIEEEKPIEEEEPSGHVTYIEEEDNTVKITFHKQHGLVGIEYPNPAYLERIKRDRYQDLVFPHTQYKSFKEGDAFQLDPAFPYLYKVIRQEDMLQVIRVNKDTNTSRIVTFKGDVDFDEFKEQMEGERATWVKTDQSYPLLIDIKDTNILADDQLHEPLPLDDIHSPHLKKPDQALYDAWVARREEVQRKRERSLVDRGIRAQEAAKSYPIYEVFVMDEIDPDDPFNSFRLFYDIAREAGYGVKVVPPAPEDIKKGKLAERSRRYIVLADKEDTRNKLEKLERLFMRHKAAELLRLIEDYNSRELLSLLPGYENTRGIMMDLYDKKYGARIKDRVLLERCFMRAEERRDKKYSEYMAREQESDIEQKFFSSERVRGRHAIAGEHYHDLQQQGLTPIEPEELVKSFRPALEEILIDHPELRPEAPPLEENDSS